MIKEPSLLKDWEKTIQNESRFCRSVTYTKNNVNTVYFMQRVIRESVIVNIDDTRLIQELEISGYPALIYIQNESGNYILQWKDENYFYILDGNMTADELLNIAESLY